MENLIKFLKSEFPKDAIEIQECIDLLNQCIGGSIESVKGSINTAVDKRDSGKMTYLMDLLVSIDSVQNKLDEYSNMLQIDDEIEEKFIENMDNEEKEIPNYNSLLVDQNMPYSLYDDFTYKRPAGFDLFGVRYIAKDWKDIFVKTCEALVSKDVSKFNSFVDDKTLQGRKVQYFCRDPKSIRAPKKVNGTDIYVMTNMSANQVRNVIESMLRKYGVRNNYYKLYLKADYTARHE